MSLAYLGLVVLYLSLNLKHQTYSEHLAMFFPKFPEACNHCPAESWFLSENLQFCIMKIGQHKNKIARLINLLFKTVILCDWSSMYLIK